VKVSPRNQTLILASERRVQGDKSSGGTLGQALDAASNGGVLKRLTIVATRPDTELVYVHADYADAASPASASSTSSGTSVVPTANQALAGAVSATFESAASSTALTSRDSSGNIQSHRRDGGLSSYLRPVDQYARTQRNWSAPASVGLDVLA
jgi:hypothetical protein